MKSQSRRCTLALTLVISLIGGANLFAQANDDQLIENVENYLNSFSTLAADVTQVAGNGAIATGSLSIHRPGRMRLDYDPPSKILLVATDWRLVFYDGSIKQVNVIPVSQTPLGVLLEREIDFADAVEVTEIIRQDGELGITVASRDNPEQGTVTLIFSEEPLQLLSWVVIDAQGNRTRIILDNVQTGIDLDPALFRWRDPRIYGYPDSD